MTQITRLKVLALAGVTLPLAAVTSQAALITDSVVFETSNQSMWSAGPTGTVRIEEFLGTRWGTYRERGDNPLADLLNISPAAKKYELGGFIGGENTCVGADTWYGCAGFRADTTTGARLEITTSGQVGVYVGAELSGGGVDVRLPVNASVSLPDQVTAGEFFTVSTTQQVSGAGASITANAPSFRAYIDGVFDTENHFFGEACIVGECVDGSFDVNINLGRFDLIEVDSSKADPWSVGGLTIPGIPLAKFTKRAPSALNPDGIDVTPPIDPTPEPLKPAILLQVEVAGLHATSGGTFQNGSLALTSANQDVFDAKLSLTGYAEAYSRPPGSPAILKNKFPLVSAPDPIPDIGVTYTIANVEVGPVLSMRQQFNFEPAPSVRLKFDVPVTRMEPVQVGTRQVKIGEVCVATIPLTGICFDYDDVFETQAIYAIQPVRHADGVVEIRLGENAQLAFNDGIGQLVDRTYLMSESSFSNTTALLARLEATAEFGCLEIPGIGEGCIFDQTWPTGNLQLGSTISKFTIGGFGEISRAGIYGFNVPGGGPGPDPDPGPGPGPIGVPEPGTLSLLLLGVFGLVAGAGRGRRGRRAQFAA